MLSAILFFVSIGTISQIGGDRVKERSFHSDQFIFQPDAALYPHVHASSLVQLPNGDFLACWYSGRTDRSQDVAIVGARLRKGAGHWSSRFVLADTPGKSDNNAALFVDRKKRLWLFWACLTEGTWETAIVKYKYSRQYNSDPIRWELEGTLDLKALLERYPDASLGWMTRNHPIELASGEMLLPLYSDRFDNSVMALTADAGRTWRFSNRIEIPGIEVTQPTVIVKSDRSLLAYMRDSSPRHRVWMCTSADGLAWSEPVQIDIPNPDSALEMIPLRSGRLLLAFNSSENDRSVLTLALSEDEGRTWPYRRDLQNEPGGRFDYPSLVEAADGKIHISYSWNVQAIKHAVVNEAWILEGGSG